MLGVAWAFWRVNHAPDAPAHPVDGNRSVSDGESNTIVARRERRHPAGGSQASSLLCVDLMATELLLDFTEFWSRLRADIARAHKSVLVQTFALEGDTVGRQLAEALLSSPARDKRVLADSFTRLVLSDRFRYSPSNIFDGDLRQEARQTAAMRRELENAGIKIKFTNPFRPTPRTFLSRNHKKLIVIDETTAYLGGINFSEHNASWHDMMLRIDDPAAVAFLRADFLCTWAGRDRMASRRLDEVELFTLDGRDNRRAFQRLFDLIADARNTIFVESPYVTFPFYERLRGAAERGVNVKIVTPGQNNWSYFANYARLESARSEIDLRLFQNGMSHLKAMLIDDEFLIAGSSNFDYLSYRLHQEIIGIFTNHKLISDFRERVMLPDIANSSVVDCRASSFTKGLLGLQKRAIDTALTIFT